MVVVGMCFDSFTFPCFWPDKIFTVSMMMMMTCLGWNAKGSRFVWAWVVEYSYHCSHSNSWRNSRHTHTSSITLATVNWLYYYGLTTIFDQLSIVKLIICASTLVPFVRFLCCICVEFSVERIGVHVACLSSSTTRQPFACLPSTWSATYKWYELLALLLDGLRSISFHLWRDQARPHSSVSISMQVWILLLFWTPFEEGKNVYITVNSSWSFQLERARLTVHVWRFHDEFISPFQCNIWFIISARSWCAQ